MLVTVRTCLGVLLLGIGTAQATTLVALDIPTLTQSSDLIVRAKVRSVSTRWSADGARIMTDAVLAVSETWKGLASPQITVMQPGGVIGEIGQRVHGTVTFLVGDEVVVFLEQRGTKYLLTGMVQGRFKVEVSSDQRALFAHQELEGEALFLDAATGKSVSPTGVMLPLEGLRAQVLAAAHTTIPSQTTRPVPVKVGP